MRRAVFWIMLVVPAFAVVWGVWFGAFPLGIPGEWEWSRIDPTGPFALAFIPPAVAAVLYVIFIWLGARRIERSRRAELSAWISGLVLCGFTWLWVAQESAPENYQLSKAAWVLYFRGSSGYFSEASEAARDLPAYLAGYELKMAEGDVLHIGTHPPGLVIIFRALLGACEAFPRLTGLVLTTEPDSVGAAFDELRRSALRKPDVLPATERAALWLAALLLQGCVALTVVPLFGLLRRVSSRRASWLATAFWPAVPALALFLPKSDCLYPLISMVFLWLWLTGLEGRSRCLCLLAGVVLFMGMMLSLAFLSVVVFAVLVTAGDAVHRRASAVAGAWTTAGFLVPCGLTWWFVRMNPFAVWWSNLHNHAGFYRQFPRTYWKWLLVNPIEFSIAAGVPLAVMALWSVLQSRRTTPDSEAFRRDINGRPRSHVWAWLATIGFLWLSGKNMGEAARLWIFLMPFLVWIAAPLFESSADPIADSRRPVRLADLAECDLLRRWGWAVALALQLATTIAIVTRVVGFDYSNL